MNYPERPAYTVADLDTFLRRCRESSIIPIVQLHDHTCAEDPALLNNLIAWWTDPKVVKVLKSHRRYLIINLANELGHYRWLGESSSALDKFKDAYKKGITSIRNAGLNMPIMIDAPDCGSSISAFTSIGQQLIDHDPKHNVLLSVHAYWAAYDGTAEIQKAVNAALPIVFGEIANKQDEYDPVNQKNLYCHYDLGGVDPNKFSYKNFLPLIGKHQVGWLAWCWWKDKCAERQMTVDGDFAGMTPYGKDLVHNIIYGLRDGKDYPAKKTASLPGAPPA